MMKSARFTSLRVSGIQRFKLRSFMTVFFNLRSSPPKGAYESFREHANSIYSASAAKDRKTMRAAATGTTAPVQATVIHAPTKTNPLIAVP
ncbi:hypothetical protein T08_9432 [Trichinella sp. T8]|nr:hypothetical protein T08_9432 [Trichinella sp. T8]